MSLAVFTGSLIEGAPAFAKSLLQAGFRITVVNSPAFTEAFSEAGIKYDVDPSISAAPEALISTAQKLQLLVAGLKSDISLGSIEFATHALVRACASQYQRVAVVVDPADFAVLTKRIGEGGSLSLSSSQKLELAKKVFLQTAVVDHKIVSQLSKLSAPAPVLVLGAGGREHAIALKLAESSRVSHVYVAPGNGGTATAGNMISNVAISSEDERALTEFARSHDIALVVIGPEAPLVIGIKDALSAAGFPCFGPSAAAARLEASKAFSKDFMARHNIPTARYRNFTDYEEAIAYVKGIDYKVVVKASGIAAGKGVILPETTEEALEAVKEVMLDKAFGDAGAEVVIEECLEGEEVSVLAFCDGRTVVTMPPAQDHKRALDGDKGLNTGGMGAYAPAPVATPAVRRKCLELLEASVKGMSEEGSPYEGVLYGGFMLTKNGPMVLEYNCRFGDPETQVLLPLLESDLFEVFQACVEGRLHAEDVQWKSGAASTVVMASKGYPESYPKGMPITGLQEAKGLPNVTVYHAGTKYDGTNVLANGGRVLAVTGTGKDIKESLERAYQGVKTVKFDPCHYRNDIAHKALNRPVRIGVLGSTRGTDMQAVIDEIEAGKLNAKIVLVISNKSDAGILERAKRHGIPAMSIASKGKSREDFDAQVSKELEAAGVELVLLIGYMRILSLPFCKQWQDRCMNVHPSLLPDFAGGMDLEVHTAVIKAGKKESGCTVHFVTEDVDGGPIVVQERCPVEADETPESLKAKVQKLEGVAFIHAIEKFMAGEVGPK